MMLSETKLAPTRHELIELCDRGVVSESQWLDRDSARAQQQLGQCRALLAAGCDYGIADSPESTESTLWIEVRYRGFNWFESGGPGPDDEQLDVETFYVPTAKRLDDRVGDWY